jgi:NAD(P)H dehydrogenase (quinone)
MSNPYVLILYYSRTQGTQNLALQMARGVDRVAGIEAKIRTVPPVSAVSERTAPTVPDDGAIFCTKDDLVNCSGLALGSVFCSTGSLHGGQETTLLTMMVPLLHHGMLIQGLPYSVPELNHTQTGGTPYGVTHVQGQDDPSALSEAETAMAQSAGQQLAETALRLNTSEKS